MKRIKVYMCWIFGLLFLAVSAKNFYNIMIPLHRGYTLNNPYTMDSVWNREENGWHNDTFLYTLLQNKVVHIHPDSWYFDYVSAIADRIVPDENVDIQIERESIPLDDFVYLDHLLAIVHGTLFDPSVIEAIASKNEDGAAGLFVEESSVLDCKEIVFFHDEAGNVYVRGYVDE